MGVEVRLVAADHQEQLAVARLRNAGCHAGFQAAGTHGFGGFVEFGVNRWREGRAVNKSSVFGSGEQIVVAEEDRVHRLVIGYDRQDDVSMGGNLCQCRISGRIELGGEFSGDVVLQIKQRRYLVALVVQAASHVASHAAEADESDCVLFHSCVRRLLLRDALL